MGTKDAIELQKQIKMIIKQLGWSQKKLARMIYVNENDSDNEVEIRQFEEKFKKELSRKTTKHERLERYLEIISQFPEFEKLDFVLPVYVRSPRLSNNMLDGMKSISKMIDDSSNQEGKPNI